MSKSHSTSLNDSQDSGIVTEKEETTKRPRSPKKSPRPVRRQKLVKGSHKSLTTLAAKDSLESVQKIRRRNETRRSFSRGSAGNDKRVEKKLYHTRKKPDNKPPVSEPNLRAISQNLDVDVAEKLITVVQPRIVQNIGINIDGLKQRRQLDPDIVKYFEKLKISDEDESRPEEDVVAEDSNVLEHSSGNQQQQQQDDTPNKLEDGFEGAVARDSRRRGVQWNREVDVIYYAGDALGGKVVCRENEPLLEESDQQARRERFIELALARSPLTNSSANQLRDPWLVASPKSKSPSSSSSKTPPALSKRLLRMCGGFLKKNLDTASGKGIKK